MPFKTDLCLGDIIKLKIVIRRGDGLVVNVESIFCLSKLFKHLIVKLKHLFALAAVPKNLKDRTLESSMFARKKQNKNMSNKYTAFSSSKVQVHRPIF